MASERRMLITVEVVKEKPGWHEAVAHSTLECFTGVQRVQGNSDATALRGLLELMTAAARRLEGLPGELATGSFASGRSDPDLPSRAERDSIWSEYRQKFGRGGC